MKIKIKKKMPISVSIKTTQVQPELEDLEVTPTTEEQNFKSSKYGYDNVKVKAVEGESLEINPSIEKQNFKGLYDEITVNEVTSNIDEDIKAENIKAGVNILGVNGSYEGVDTSDATATSGDILKDKTAYVNNEKVIGTIENYDGSYSGNIAEGIKITDASYLFYNGVRLDSLDELLKLCNSITSMRNMFYSCRNLTELNLSNLDTSNVTTMQATFNYCTNLTELDLSNFNTGNVTNMNNMFANCGKLKTLNISSFNTSKVTNMSSMFATNKITNIDLSSFDTSNVTNMSQLFYACSSLTSLDISNFDASQVNTISGIFEQNENLTNLSFMTNLGKGYTTPSNNWSSYTLDLSSCEKLTHESLMSVINNLYDLNLTHDVANGGTLYRQKLVLGSTNLAKLTEDEIAIATNKGWNVS